MGTQPNGHLPPGLLGLWAKLRSDDPEQKGYHPLLYHMLDVAAVAGQLWSEVLTESARRDVATRLGVDEHAAGRWIAFLAGTHDVGKGAPIFALQDSDVAGRLMGAGLPCTPVTGKAPHGVISAWELRDILMEFGLTERLALKFAMVVGGHHGAIPSPSDIERLPNDAIGQEGWREIRRHLCETLAREVQLPRSSAPSSLSHSTALWLAGFISVADWIGSNQRFFPFGSSSREYAPEFDPDYLRHADLRASDALQSLGWFAQPGASEAMSFEEMFQYSPNAMQRQVIELGGRLDVPGLVIIEAPMGEGKTEAALWLADQWHTRLGQRGFYIALPTQATSDQMFDRVSRFLARRHPTNTVNLQLMHGHSSLSSAFAALKTDKDWLSHSPEIYGEDHHVGKGDRSGVVAAEWFTHRKRGHLAPFGVGTIDQVLLAVLQVKHVFVRLFGLSHKTVIIDEVHAYDTYMSTLLDQLLTWLGALNTSVVLLSATLPDHRRCELARAYARGIESDADGVVPDARYPRITWLGKGQDYESFHIETAPAAQKTLKLKWVDDTLPDASDADFALGRQLREALVDGGTAAIICNTVRRAQAVFTALKPYFPDTASDGAPELDLLHARYPFDEREAREKRTLLRFGKQGATVDRGRGAEEVRRPRRAVLVSTQIIEQSLDLDFDLMVTDLAPADLVLQRAGRLQRHDRGAARPERLRPATLWICGPREGDDGVPVFDRGSEYVYFAHVLLRSWLALRPCHEIAIPGDIELLIEAVYADRSPDHLDPVLRERWIDTLRQQQVDIADEEREANKRLIQLPFSEGWLHEVQGAAREEDRPELHPALQMMTRLVDPSVSVVLLDAVDGQPCLPDGRSVNPSRKPDLELTGALLRRSLSISDRRVVHRLLEEPVPGGWQRSPLLQNHRLVELSRHGGKRIGKYTIRLDPELGLIITEEDEC